MRLELLAGQVALALDRLAVARVDPEQVVEPPLQLADERIVRVDIARVRGAIAGFVTGIEGAARLRDRVDDA